MSESGPERALGDLLEFAQRLGYQPVREAQRQFFPNPGDARDAE